MEELFKTKLGCTNVPKEVMDFYEKQNGMTLSINEIFSKERIIEELNGNFKMFLNSGIKHNEDDLLIPIANDGMGGYYAFVGNREDENIYYFDHEFPNEEPVVYTINEIIDMDSND